ncbi:hypothetical protein AiwAL_10600 [Acidiphilium sp. AL]|uniref:hypothetical protein n=1 Tax=Acidiphilium sp. AL TaxID=2871704 RepID=UPI0021CB63D1|nr:hypothetical protein [Acidiphilium sp. AL]MCU4160550.1 hypothetical protein [Acidiphilium sp. AL]
MKPMFRKILLMTAVGAAALALSGCVYYPGYGYGYGGYGGYGYGGGYYAPPVSGSVTLGGGWWGGGDDWGDGGGDWGDGGGWRGGDERH